MNPVLATVVGVLRGLLKVVLIGVCVLLVVAAIGFGLLLAAIMAIRFLVTGRKPSMATTFAHFQHSTQRFRPTSWPGQGSRGSSGTGDVVDVPAHEVHPALGSSPSTVKPE
jgi:hypothetical protein